MAAGLQFKSGSIRTADRRLSLIEKLSSRAAAFKVCMGVDKSYFNVVGSSPIGLPYYGDCSSMAEREKKYSRRFSHHLILADVF